MDFTNDIKFSRKPTSNQLLRISYFGNLVKENSSELYLVFGYGENWEYTTEKKMEKIDNGFSTKIKIKNYNKFNFCFKNENNIWDNNNSKDYTAKIIDKPKINKIKTLNLAKAKDLCIKEIDNVINCIDLDLSKEPEKIIDSKDADVLEYLMQEIVKEYSTPEETSNTSEIKNLNNSISDSFYDDFYSHDNYENFNNIVNNTFEELDKANSDSISLENLDYKENAIDEYTEYFNDLINEIIDSSNKANENVINSSEESNSEDSVLNFVLNEVFNDNTTQEPIAQESDSEDSVLNFVLNELFNDNIAEESITQESDSEDSVLNFVLNEVFDDNTIQESIAQELNSEDNIVNNTNNFEEISTDVKEEIVNEFSEVTEVSEDLEKENSESVSNEYALYDYKSYSSLYIIVRRIKQIISTLFSKLPSLFKNEKDTENN